VGGGSSSWPALIISRHMPMRVAVGSQPDLRGATSAGASVAFVRLMEQNSRSRWCWNARVTGAVHGRIPRRHRAGRRVELLFAARMLQSEYLAEEEGR